MSRGNTSPGNESTRLVRVVIPAMNEEGRIRDSVSAYCEYFGERATILVVANGCTDGTASVVRGLSAQYENLQLIEIAAPIGKGGAVRAGLKVGREPYLAFVDADGSTRADQVELLVDVCRRTEMSGAIGSRWLRESIVGRKQPWRRRIASRAFNLLVRILFGLPYTDTQCGGKVFERSAIDGVLHQLELANFAFDVDLLVSLNRLGFGVVEVPIAWDDVPDYSKVALIRAGSSMFWALIHLWLRHSMLRHLPWTDLLGRSSIIPVKPGLKFLVLLSGAPLQPREERLLDEIRLQGHEIYIKRLSTIIDVVSFSWHYVRFGHRTYDVIADLLAYNGWPFTGFSTKPKIYPASLESLRTDEIGPLVQSTAARCGYNAFFWRYEDSWILSSARAETVLQESH